MTLTYRCATCRTSSPKAQLIGGEDEFEQLVAQFVGFVEAPSIGLHLPLDVQGTAGPTSSVQPAADLTTNYLNKFVE